RRATRAHPAWCQNSAVPTCKNQCADNTLRPQGARIEDPLYLAVNRILLLGSHPTDRTGKTIRLEKEHTLKREMDNLVRHFAKISMLSRLTHINIMRSRTLSPHCYRAILLANDGHLNWRLFASLLSKERSDRCNRNIKDPLSGLRRYAAAKPPVLDMR